MLLLGVCSKRFKKGCMLVMNELYVGVAQAAAVSNDVAANMETAVHLLDIANKEGANLVVFPELFLCGYDLEAISADPKRAAVELKSATIQMLRERCAALGVAVIIGACMQGKGGLTNSAIVIDNAGRILDVYDKLHLYGDEKKAFVLGNHMSIVQLFGFRVGVGICYDAGFPEFARSLTVGGAELIAYPSAWIEGEAKYRYYMYYATRAVENTVYVVVPNLIGEVGSSRFFGESVIYEPNGVPLGMARDDQTVLVRAIARERITEVRRGLPYLADLRNEVYWKGK